MVPGGQYQVMMSTASRPASTAGSASGELPGSLNGSGSVERQPAQRRIGLPDDRAIGRHLTRLAQPGVIRQVLALYALELVVRIVRGVGRAAEQHQFE